MSWYEDFVATGMACQACGQFFEDVYKKDFVDLNYVRTCDSCKE